MRLRLQDRVRVSGGAYGGFCDFDSHSGMFTYLSYRDPNLLGTVDVYDGTGDFLRGLEMDEDAMSKAIIGCIGEIDSYQVQCPVRPGGSLQRSKSWGMLKPCISTLGFQDFRAIIWQPSINK
eukprot:180473-Pyramimonas_sp.AAC.3